MAFQPTVKYWTPVRRLYQLPCSVTYKLVRQFIVLGSQGDIGAVKVGAMNNDLMQINYWIKVYRSNKNPLI